MRIEKCHHWQRLLRHQMMVHDDGVDAQRGEPLERSVVGGAAVAGDEQLGAVRKHALERLARQAVAALETARQNRRHVAA